MQVHEKMGPQDKHVVVLMNKKSYGPAQTIITNADLP